MLMFISVLSNIGLELRAIEKARRFLCDLTKNVKTAMNFARLNTSRKIFFAEKRTKKSQKTQKRVCDIMRFANFMKSLYPCDKIRWLLIANSKIEKNRQKNHRE